MFALGIGIWDPLKDRKLGGKRVLIDQPAEMYIAHQLLLTKLFLITSPFR